MSKALDILGVVSPSALSIAKPEPGQPSLMKTIVPGAAAGVLGFALFPAHPVLGFFGGEALGLNAIRFIRNQDSDRTRATCNLAMTASMIVGSLAWKKHPFYGACLGIVAGAIITSFVPGSNAHKVFRG